MDDNKEVDVTVAVHGSIKDRLAELKKNQIENWKHRLKKDEIDVFVDPVTDDSGLASTNSKESTSSKVLSALSLLENSQNEWRKRVETKDATKFTVAGKLNDAANLNDVSSEKICITNWSEKTVRISKPVRFQGKADSKAANEKALQPNLLPIIPSLESCHLSQSNIYQETLRTVNFVTVSIPKLDDETFSSFFQSATSVSLQFEKLDVDEDDFDCMLSQSIPLVVQKRTVPVVRRRRTFKRNPLKALASCNDLVKYSYMELKTGIAEKELRRMKLEQSKHSHLATSALAGLISTEDFTAVNLRQRTSRCLTSNNCVTLLHIKGRRHVQTRIVEPSATSITSGDSFVLVTSSQVYNYVGRFCNVIERAKGAEVALVVQSKKQLGYCGFSPVVTLDMASNCCDQGKLQEFFEHIGGDQHIAEPKSAEEDEFYETAVAGTNKVYTVSGKELVPYERYWGYLPSIKMLRPNDVIVFDFGTEMYVWQGKYATHEKRRHAICLAKELWNEGYDYSDCDVNPFDPLHHNSFLDCALKRPDWAVFSKISQHMETVLFYEKFSDWPNTERILKVNRNFNTTIHTALQPCDVYQMLNEMKNFEPDVVLEGCHLGRGQTYFDKEERRTNRILTLGIKVWHILEYSHVLLPQESWGQFHSGDTYVIRWQYRVSVQGRKLCGDVSLHTNLGRERCVYFFWQGRDSTINEKGASALMTVELDEERGPHVRVVQGQEPPCFLNLFNGSMIVYCGKRGCITNDKWRFFLVRGDFEQEAHLTELCSSNRSLRCQGAYVFLNYSTGIIHFWVGSKASSEHVQAARIATSFLRQRKPVEMGFRLGAVVTVKEQLQNEEDKLFWDAFGRNDKRVEFLSNCSNTNVNYTPRLFHMTSSSGIFVATEIFCSFHSNQRITFPFLQEDLYDAQQPALFLLDNESEVYVWHGWWPEVGSDDNLVTGSSRLRFNEEKRLTLETAMKYCEVKNTDCLPYLIWAGMEPEEFKNIFPYWEIRNDAPSVADKTDGGKRLVADVLGELKSTYSYVELLCRPLPESLDPLILEGYLSNSEFEEVFKMTRNEFCALPRWKQHNMKKAVGLFC